MEVLHRHQNFSTHLLSQLQEILSTRELVDVTLACQGEYVQAHKLILSASSPYFRALLNANPCQHPIIILQDASLHHVKAMLQFMYFGETMVSQEELPGFFKTAKALKISGLIEHLEPKVAHQQPSSRTARDSHVLSDSTPAPSFTQTAPSQLAAQYWAAQGSMSWSDQRSPGAASLVDLLQQHQPPQQNNFNQGDHNRNNFLSSFYARDFNKREKMNHLDNSEAQIICKQCGKTFKKRTSYVSHVKYSHGKDSEPVTCTICGHVLKNKLSLRCHMNFYHEGKHAGKRHECEHCGKTYTLLSNLKAHEKHDHVAIMKHHRCNSCYRSFVDEETLRLHKCTLIQMHE